MGVEIDRRPLWVILGLKGIRPLFFITLLLGFWAFVSLPTFEGLTRSGHNSIAVFLLCLILWVSNAIPLAITSILAVVLIPLLGVLSNQEAYSLFGNEAVFFILGAFILAGAVMNSGLSNRVALAIMERFGGSPKRLLVSIFLLAASLSCIMSEHAVAAMLFPIVLEIAKSLKLRPGKSGYGKLLFLSLAWGCVIGGIATFLGGARVPLAVGILKESTGDGVGFFYYTLSVLPIVVVMLVVGYAVLSRVFSIDIESVEEAREVLQERGHSMGKVKVVEYAVGIVLIGTVITWSFFGEVLGLANIALASVVILFVFKLVRWKDIEEYVNWGIILMYGGAIALGTSLERSGAALWLAESIMGEWATSPTVLVGLLSALTMALTEGISNAAVIAILVPISIGMSESFAMDPVIMTYAVAVPAGLAFILPMSTPANAFAVSSSFLTVKDMVKAGLIMSLTGWVVFNLVANLWWPLLDLAF